MKTIVNSERRLISQNFAGRGLLGVCPGALRVIGGGDEIHTDFNQRSNNPNNRRGQCWGSQQPLTPPGVRYLHRSPPGPLLSFNIQRDGNPCINNGVIPPLKPKYRSRNLSVSSSNENGDDQTIGGNDKEQDNNNADDQSNSPQRVWMAVPSDDDNDGSSKPVHPTVWTRRVADGADDPGTFSELLHRVQEQETEGGRLRARQYGVLHEDPATDMELLTQNYTVAALASALRDREDVLQHTATLANEERWDELAEMLKVFHPKYVLERRAQKQPFNVTECLNAHALEVIRRALVRMPRAVTQAHSERAGVVIPLCLVDDTPCLLLERRSAHHRAHRDEVCLPGGMVCQINDQNIVGTCLREMQEEIGGLDSNNIQVLGVFRCNWGEVHHLVGVAVTPVVCFLGDLPEILQPCAREVSELFTVPLSSLSKKHLWVHKEGMAPIFLGGPHVIWGLTGYILDRFYKDILLPSTRVKKGVDL